ncbi:speckle-type POZ protein-like B [Uloborus diversus]|uniref:speckle-type POZ protein-like B n=1 Tax=Uloborus diversus TaxID=327109 RepID=UPI00240A97A4|nr:speckle-type POZ protein-like B [Uloborus diversus]
MLVLPDDVTEAASTSGTKTLATDMKGLFEDPRHSDVTIRVGKEEFSAHKAILACRSKVFRAMFESGMKECQENTLDLVGMEHSTARSMLEYIYTGSLGKLSMEEAFDLYVAADRYNLQDIKDGCKECILKDMSADQACEVAAFANLHSDEVLLMASCLALKNNFQQVAFDEPHRSTAGAMTLATDMKTLFEDPLHSDVTLRVGQEEFSAHKAILSSRSKVFRDIFESGANECQENTLDLVGMKHSTARSMLKYIYTGCLDKLEIEEAFDLYTAADKYDLQKLKSWCKKCILNDMSADDVCEVAVFATLHSDEDLLMASCCTLKSNLHRVLNTEKWSNFAKQNRDLYSELIEKVVLM